MVVTKSKILRTAILLAGLSIVVGLGTLCIGAADIPVYAVLRDLFLSKAVDPSSEAILFEIRLPRILMAAAIGATLSICGVVMQSILRNPLAEPFILGLSGGAAVGAILFILLGISVVGGSFFFSFIGAMLTLFLVLALSKRRTGFSTTRIILTGVIVNAFFTAFIMFVITTTSDELLYAILFWLYGDLSGSVYVNVGILLAVLVPGFGVVYVFSRYLNILGVNEELGYQLGIEVEKVKYLLLIIVSILTAFTVSLGGIIGFVGLIVPHLMRMAFGNDHRLLLPTSALFGAIFMMLADTAARTIVYPSELPVGVITAFLGAPFFLMLMFKDTRGWSQ
ncbi:MAG: iron ABC transporter permease [Deltaproteobacteria bacterium]|nr:iron ABC transporter permease [Deltaproteobacteria bacterium]